VVTVNGTSGTLHGHLNCSIATFDPDDELEWSTVAYAHYLPPTNRWTNRFDETYSFDDCIRLLLARPRKQAACVATHIPYAICTLLRIDQEVGILSDDSKAMGRAYLKQISDSLERNQRPDGSWPIEWWNDSEAELPASDFIKGHFAAITSAGHQLEWIALAPRELRPSTDSIAACVRSACRLVRFISRHDLNEIYPPVSHFARALCLIRATSPADVLSGTSDYSRLSKE
jgi:hypothetical protein